jgi:hypothetical protein
MAAYVPFSHVANLTGQPSMSVALYWNEEGLAIGGPQNWMRFGEEWGRSKKL